MSMYQTWTELKKELISLNEVEKCEIEIMARLVNRIVERRRELDLTQSQLGELSGFKQSYIARIESGNVVPKLDNLIRIGVCMGLNIDFYVTEQKLGREETTATLVV